MRRKAHEVRRKVTCVDGFSVEHQIVSRWERNCVDCRLWKDEERNFRLTPSRGVYVAQCHDCRTRYMARYMLRKRRGFPPAIAAPITDERLGALDRALGDAANCAEYDHAIRLIVVAWTAIIARIKHG